MPPPQAYEKNPLSYVEKGLSRYPGWGDQFLLAENRMKSLPVFPPWFICHFKHIYSDGYHNRFPINCTWPLDKMLMRVIWWHACSSSVESSQWPDQSSWDRLLRPCRGMLDRNQGAEKCGKRGEQEVTAGCQYLLVYRKYQMIEEEKGLL